MRSRSLAVDTNTANCLSCFHWNREQKGYTKWKNQHKLDLSRDYDFNYTKALYYWTKLCGMDGGGGNCIYAILQCLECSLSKMVEIYLRLKFVIKATAIRTHFTVKFLFLHIQSRRAITKYYRLDILEHTFSITEKSKSRFVRRI